MARYIYPPRTAKRIRPVDLADLESSQKWLGQRKFNGDRCVAVVDHGNPTQKTQMGNRRGKWHSPSKHREIRRELLRLNLPPNGTHYLDGELLESIGVLVLFDVLQITEMLFDPTQSQRLVRLIDVCGDPQEHCQQTVNGVPLALQVSDHIWLAERWCDDFKAHYSECLGDNLIEGLVLRQWDSHLDNFGSSAYEIDWMLRCRKPSKNYRY